MESTLSKLVEEGFVSREQGEYKRLDRVKLTEKGADPKNMPEGRVSKVFGALTEEEREQLASILDKLNAGFEKELDLPEDPKERRAAMCQRSSAG
jgi:DNA-binding MarR family transcriptional regulator